MDNSKDDLKPLPDLGDWTPPLSKEERDEFMSNLTKAMQESTLKELAKKKAEQK